MQGLDARQTSFLPAAAIAGEQTEGPLQRATPSTQKIEVTTHRCAGMRGARASGSSCSRPPEIDFQELGPIYNAKTMPIPLPTFKLFDGSRGKIRAYNTPNPFAWLDAQLGGAVL